MSYAVALHWQRVQTKQVFRIPVRQFAERAIFAFLDLRILNAHRHLDIGVLVALSDNEVTFKFADGADADVIAFRPQMRI